jgi:hypothetical protein
MAIDTPVQISRRFEYHHAKGRHFGAGLRVTGDNTLTLPETIFRHNSLSFSPDHREMRIAAQEWETHSRTRLLK